ncbi:MAG: hypothetical protein Q8S43_01035 [Actinomycetota bacterium]|nr:MAG: hypothetical protein FD171_130 [Actinomycetota bacterium]MDO8950618.1 hypothetical protein [Actinomycetota bacterium]MDP3629524.1 hypothetical protein [Actinomycetota bacterium]
MFTRTIVTLTALVLAMALVGCTSSPTSKPITNTPPPAVETPATGTRLAPGMYDMQGGTVQAIGTLEYRDIEGGVWAIIGGTQADGNLGETVAVIANAAEFSGQLKALTGKTVIAIGRRAGGMSIRMAGPEMVLESISEISDTPGPAQ